MMPLRWLICWFVTGAALLSATPKSDFRASSPSDATPSARSDPNQNPGGPRVDSSRRGRLEDMVEVLGVAMSPPDAKGSCKVTVRVRYALVHYPKGILALGFNLKSPTSYTQVSTRPVMAGAEDIELTANVVPAVWPKPQPFKVYVGLSAEPRPGKWSLLAAVNQAVKPDAASRDRR